MSEELLDLATVVDRDTVRIRSKKNPQGKVYELLNMNELGAFEHAILADRHRRTRDLVGRTDRKTTPAEKRTATKALKDILVQIVVDLEPAVLAEISMGTAAQLVAAWALKQNPPGAADGLIGNEADLEKLSVTKLKTLAADHDIAVHAADTKPKIIAKLVAAAAGAAEGED